MTGSLAAASEFEGLDLGDKRLNKRIVELMGWLGASPALSFPKAFRGDDALLCAAYGLMGHARLEPLDFLPVHFRLSLARARHASLTYVAHDTTEVLHPSSGLHLFLHLAFCTASTDSVLSAGLVGAEFNTRPQNKKRSNRDSHERKKDPNRESLRWGRLVLDVHQRAGEGASQLMHLMDREGDIYELLAQLLHHGVRFIIRCKSNRACAGEDGERDLLFPVLEQAQGRFTREVPLSGRKAPWSPKDQKTHPERDARTTTLSYAGKSITIHKPGNSVDVTLPKSMTLNYVHVWEEKPPEGEKAVDWKLVTLEPIGTEAELQAVVDGYRKRWPIEELNKGLKTGCQVETSQLEDPKAVQNHVAMMLPVAWKLLQMRNLERDRPDAPASEVLSEVELEVLRAMLRRKWSETPTVKEALWAVAQMGGHLKRNGPPGWLTLMRGYVDLLQQSVVWLAAKRSLATPSGSI